MDGYARLEKLVEGQTDLPLLKVVDYLLTCDDMSDKYLNEEKSLKSMIDYIKGEARKLAKDNVAMVEDETVYEWAVKYFSETDEVLGIKKSTPIPTTPIIESKPVKPEKEQYGQLALF